jgi:predicted acetyltransferase
MGIEAPTEVRTIGEADVAAWVSCMKVGFFGQVAEGEPEFRRGGMDLDRSWGAFDGNHVVGTLRSIATALSVPGPAGAHVAAAGLTNVTVAPTHRRRGLLSDMITRDLRASADRGEAVGILIASEYPIYGRFGYGPAVEGTTCSLDASLARFREQALGSFAGSVELVDLGGLRRLAPPLYEQLRQVRPGFIERNDRWWDRELQQITVPGSEPLKGYQAVYRSAEGEAEGYVRYHGKEEWDQMRPKVTLTVDELVAVTTGAYHRLWQYCCEVDWVTRVEAGERSVDEVLPWLLTDGRLFRQTSRFDFVWLRMLDVAAALSARRYLSPGQVTIEVVDPLGLAAGRYLLDGGPSGASCAPTDKTPDLSLPVHCLGSAYLGGVPLATLAAAGLVDEHRAGSVATFDAMLRWAVAPWCSTWF